MGQLSVATGRRVLSLASTRLPPLFFVSSSGSQTLEVTSHFAYAAKGAASANRLVLVGSKWLPPLFLVSSVSGLALGS